MPAARRRLFPVAVLPRALLLGRPAAGGAGDVEVTVDLPDALGCWLPVAP